MQVEFSRRTAWDTGEASLTRAVREARAAGQELIDLTVSNPTVCGFQYDEAMLLGALGDPAGLVYDPDPRGIRTAREAVAGYYRDHGAVVSPDHILLTTSTSEAYSYLFRLLCNPGDAVLAPQPSYPLFDFLADLDDVVLHTFPLFYDFGWWIDFAELERRITPQTRAILLVHPNNPTGHTTSRKERELLQEICVRHGLAMIVDEVFLDYGLAGPVNSFATGEHPCLTFVVSGMSKIAALPQMKVGWLAAFGPARCLADALARLEIVADTFLSVNAPMQHALPVWLAGRLEIQRQIRSRVLENLACLQTDDDGLSCLEVEAGWSAVVRVGRLPCDGDLAEGLVREAGVIVHPGAFYGLAGVRQVVVSLLGRPEAFVQGVVRLTEWIARE